MHSLGGYLSNEKVSTFCVFINLHFWDRLFHMSIIYYRMKSLFQWKGQDCLFSVKIIWTFQLLFSWYSAQFSSVSQSCPTLCDPMNGSTPGLPVHHQLPEFIQTYAHRVSDAIQPSHPLSPPLLLLPSGSFSVSWLFASGGQSIGASASVLPKNIQDWFPLGWTGWISLQSKGPSKVFSNTTVQKHQLFSTQFFL